MNKRKLFVVIGIVIVVIGIVAGMVGYFMVKDVKQEQALRKEIKSLNKLDITKDRYNTDIVTKGDYAVVEKAIKEYLDEYATNLQDVLAILKDETLSNVLSAENYKNDGPEFKKTKEYLDKTKTEFNEKLTKLTNMTDKKNIMKQIEDKKLTSYYVDLYKELMLNGVAAKDLKDSKEELKKASDSINKLLETETNVIDLLIENKGKWNIENDTIVFKDNATLEKYNNLIKSYTNS